jgi:hypothetical protein
MGHDQLCLIGGLGDDPFCLAAARQHGHLAAWPGIRATPWFAAAV